jgi:DNA mismatch repair protein MSH6
VTTSQSIKRKEKASIGLSKQEQLLSMVQVGTAISVYWPDDDEYYNAKVTSKKREPSGNSNVVTLLYEDGEVETIDLTHEVFKILDKDASPSASQESATSSKLERKRKIIHESEEEEFEPESEDDEEDSEEEFVVEDNDSNGDYDEDDSEAMDVTDEDAEDSSSSNRKKKSVPARKRLCVTSIQSPNELKRSNQKNSITDKRHSSASFITPPPNTKSNVGVAKSNSLASFASDSSMKNKKTSYLSEQQKVTPMSQLSPPSSANKRSSSTKFTIPFPLNGVVNQAGTHYHNHFAFLQPENIRDAEGRPASHPDYNCRTLKVDYQEMERVTGSKLTPASQQWWDLKSQYADAILLFKTGKFYEIFHMDADVAVQVLGFSYMKGPVAHAGFPEVGYGVFAEKLVKAGYKVARVEQTETPEMLKERKNNSRKGAKKPMVVNREVCSIVSSGTRTFCYMDDVCALDGDNGNCGIGPLLAIKEIMTGNNDTTTDSDEDRDCVRPVSEYGITVVDAATGVITVGQFADDVLRSRMNTLLTKFRPSEVLVGSGTAGASKTLISLLQSMKKSILPSCKIEKVHATEIFPQSNAIDADARSYLQRPSQHVKPWDKEETLRELHRRGYYPRASKNSKTASPYEGIGRWPDVLKACVQGGADLALSSFGATLFYLQRSLIDDDILSLGIVKAYIPPDPASISGSNITDNQSHSFPHPLSDIASKQQRQEDGTDADDTPVFTSNECDISMESEINHLSLDGTTIANLEILTNSHSNTLSGSLWSKINFTKSPFGSRLLRAWLLRPLFRKSDIDRRADAVEELVHGAAAAAMSEARNVLSKCGDLERLLSRVHSMGGNGKNGSNAYHPNDRAVLYETAIHTKRKVGDFSKLLNGLRALSQIPEIFDGIEIKSALLTRIVRTTDRGGLFPSKLGETLDWYFDNFDCKKAADGLFEPTRGMDEEYDSACDSITRIKQELEDYKNEMCSCVLKPSHLAKKEWTYVNVKVDSKDKYIIELPIHIQVPGDFIVKGKRGKGAKQVNKYRTPVVERLVEELERAYDVMKAGKARGMQLVFAKFDSMRTLWASAAQASAMIDALGSLAQASSKAGYTRPIIKDCAVDDSPSINIMQGRHPCVEFTHSGGDFIPNDLEMGSCKPDEEGAKILLLSGPNMGGKSTLLRQTCLIAILAQIGCFVPAEKCVLTPFDRIFTRLGASDRILLGQSTFFVELAETAAALRGATRRSLVIMDELGRGTSTFDGTAIASAAVKHLIERNRCISLFATHYHSLLEDWKGKPGVRLGHMECVVEETESAGGAHDVYPKESNITFLYTLGEGGCPKSFGINVARLAGLPEEVLQKAKNISLTFEDSMNILSAAHHDAQLSLTERVKDAVNNDDWSLVEKLWDSLQ